MNTYIMEKHMYQRERNVFYEMLATEICKQDFFMDPTLRKNRKLCDQGYQDIAKILGLSNADEVKKEIVNMKKYVHNKMRRCVRLSIIHGSGGLDAWNYAPDWFKQLEKPYNLLQTARKLELMNSFKYCRSGKRVIYFTSELTKCARSAAARELAKGSEHASRVLTSKEAVREYAETMDMEVDPFYKIWTRLYTQSLQKLMALIEVGDCSEKLVACKRLSLQDWLAVDTGLLYDISLKVVSEKCFKSSTTLNSLILLYKLMIAAHDKIRQIKAKPTNSSMPHIGCQNEETGAQTGTQLFESSNNLVTNVASCSNATESILPDDTPLVIDEKIKEETVHKSNTVKKGSNEYETAEIWTLVHMSYTSRERSASVVLLQKRWHELKQHTRDLLWGLSPSPIQLTPAPILLALGKRFPYILIEKMPPWSELIRNNQVFLDSDLESYRTEYAKINFNLDVPKDIQEKILLDELNDWSDDDIEVINENKETIILSDTDDEQTNSNPDNNKKTNKNISEISAVDDECIKKLESIDPTTAKVKLIFEDDSDSDVNEFLNNDNDNNVLNSNFNSNHTTKSLDSLNNKKIAEPKHESEIISPDSNERGKYRFRLRYGNYSSDIYKVKKKISQPVCDPVDDEIEPVVNRIKDTRSGQSEVKKLIQNINDEVDDKLKYLRNNLISELNNESANGRFSNLHIKTETAEDLSINIKQEPCIQNSLASDVLNTNISVINNSERSECKLAKDNDKIGDETWGDQVADDDEHLSDTNIKEEPCIDNSHTSDVDKINIYAINDSERSESRLVTDNDKVGDEALGDQVTNVEHLSNTNIKQEPNIDNNYITDINISITEINDTERSESRLATDNDKVRDVVLNDKVIDDKHLSNSKIKQELHKDNSDTSNVNETNIATNNDSERSETKFATNNDKGDKATGDQVTDDDKHLNNTNIKHEPHKNNILITKIETSVTEINDLETSENSFANDNERLGDQVTGDKHLSKTNIKPEPYIKNSYTLNVNKTNISLINGVDGSESRLVNDNDEVCDEALGVQVADNDDNLRGEDYVDDKLVKLSCVILTPIEDTYEWETYSRNDIINCRRFSVRNFTRKHVLTSKELAKCRRYEPPKNVLRNGISAKKNREFEKLPKSLKERRHYLTRYLNLSRTCFSLEFWNERNIELLELCRPLSVRMNKSARVVKKIELADIDEVRRINRSILTAQVAPITVAANRMLVIDPMSTNNSKKSKPIQDDLSNDSDSNKDNYNFTLSYNHDSKLPAITLTILPNQQGDALIGNEMSSIKPKLCMDVTDNSDSGVHLDCNKPPKVSEVKDLIKNIVRKGDIPILPGKTRRVPTKGDSSFANKQKELERDIREISKGLMQRLDMTRKKRKEKKRHKKFIEPVRMPMLSGSEEWQRQKTQNLIYFNFQSATDRQTEKEKKT